MGRKLRFFVTKNQERKKALAARTRTLPVSIPLSLGVAVHQLSVEVDVEKPSELTVMLPIAAYANAPCQDLAHLRSRLLPFHYAGCEVFSQSEDLSGRTGKVLWLPTAERPHSW